MAKHPQNGGKWGGEAVGRVAGVVFWSAISVAYSTASVAAKHMAWFFKVKNQGQLVGKCSGKVFGKF